MAKNSSSIRGIHVSPGVYSRETELQYAVKSLGITTLGLAGETLRGPAFQPMHISDWREFVDTFGGTSTEKFKGSQYPKYELPYIAKSYLSESNQLEVVRVLGFSGYKAGPAWAITADLKNGKKMVVAILRSRGHYEKYRKFDASTGSCQCPNEEYDALIYDVGEVTAEENQNFCYVTSYNNIVKLKPYTPIYSTGNDCDKYVFSGDTEEGFPVSSTNYGSFTIYGLKGPQAESAVTADWDSTNPDYFEYAVTLNPGDKDYILKVLGSDPEHGEAPLFVEALYDVALGQAINSGNENEVALNISSDLTFYQVYDPSDYCGLEPITGLMSLPENALSRKNLGQRFLADANVKGDKAFTVHAYDYMLGKPEKDANNVTSEDVENAGTDDLDLVTGTPVVGQVYTVSQYTAPDGKRHYFYRFYTKKSVDAWKENEESKHPDQTAYTVNLTDRLQYGLNGKRSTDASKQILVKNLADGLYYRLISTDRNEGVTYVSTDLNNYASSYRYASTPWIVSNLKGDYNHIELTKLFRFHTISDGNASNNEVKVSIEEIRPDDGTFNVVVRAINDIDESPVVLEKFTKCTLVPGTRGYIGFKIGTFDGIYESKSKFITVEVAEGEAVEHSVPAGFMGYPMPKYDGLEVVDEMTEKDGIVNPFIKYNQYFDVDTKNRKQYFGLSTRTGVDIDMFTYKGKSAYIDLPLYSTQGFHLDSRLNRDNYEADNYPLVTVDGVKGYEFDAVASSNRTEILSDAPVIGTEAMMQGTIYEYSNLRKFTLYFYGGFDGWDVYRAQRSNTNDFKLSKYLGAYDGNSGEGYAFNRIDNGDTFGLNQNGITSDWYAYLAAYRQFANPEVTDINVFATPGIDYVNNTSLVEEVISMVEEERADSIYVVTTPDKPSGAADFVDEMFTPEDAVYNLEDSEVASNYACTYYPWVKYLDQDNNQYIYLPPTKDVVRNFALTDNTRYSWYAPAGIERGNVNAVRTHMVTRLADEDVLYGGRINPIKTFATDGIKIWGQKTLMLDDNSQLSRIAVRRLLLRMRKLIAIACRGLIFEPNDTITRNNFLSIVTPIMDNIRSNRGISDYRIEVDDSVEARDRRELPAKIFFKPFKALEYILLDFIITPEGISFDDI